MGYQRSDLAHRYCKERSGSQDLGMIYCRTPKERCGCQKELYICAKGECGCQKES